MQNRSWHVQLKHRTPNSEVHLITRVIGMGTPLYYSHTLLISSCARLRREATWGGRERAVTTSRKHHLLECAPPPCSTIVTTPPPILPRFPLQLEMNSTMCSLCKLPQNEGIIMTKTNLTIRNHQLKWFVKALSQLNHTPDHSVNHHLQYMDILQVIQTWRPGNEATQYPKHKQWNDKAS